MAQVILLKMGLAIITAVVLLNLFQSIPPVFGKLDYTTILFALTMVTYALLHPIEKHHKKILALMLTLAILVRIPIITADFITIIKYFFADDAYIWLSIARELYENHWCSFNGIEPAAGGPPMWAIMLAPLHYMIEDPYLMTRIVLTINLVFFIGSAWILYDITKKYIPIKWSLLTITLYLFNPYILANTMNGMETILFILLLLASIKFYLEKEINPKNSLILGVLIGATTLTRDEGILLYLSILTSIICATKKKKEKLKVKELAYMTCAFILLITPWVMYKVLTFHTLTSSSSLQRFWMGHNWIDPMTLGLMGLLSTSIKKFIETIIDSSKVFGWPLYLVGLSYVILNIRKILIEPFAVYATYNILFYGLFIWEGGRYNAPFHVFICFGIAYTLHKIFGELNEKFRVNRNKKQFAATLVPIVIILLVFQSTYISYKRLDEPVGVYKDPNVASQYDEYLAAMWITENLPKGSIIAAYNIGLEQYFSGAHIIDLYGNMDYAALKAFREKKVWEYIQERNVSYYIARKDRPGKWSFLNWTVADFRGLPLNESWEVWESPNKKYAIYKTRGHD